jgi:hypothetical protein
MDPEEKLPVEENHPVVNQNETSVNQNETSVNQNEKKTPTAGGKRRKTAKKSGGKRKGNAWTKLVTKTFKDNRKTNKNYTFKQAIQDARKVYKK